MEESFYQTLFSDDSFAMAVGRMTMSSARLESCMKLFMESHGSSIANKKAPLGAVIKTLIANHTIDRTAIGHLQFILQQRNYFVHKLHPYLSEYPSNHSELIQLTNRANALIEEMEFFSNIFMAKCKPAGA